MSALYFEDTDTLEVIWGPVDPTAIIAELQYTDTLGNQQMLTIPREQTGADTTWITDYDHAAEGRFQYRSVYLPDTLSVDTFYTAYTQVKRSEEHTSELQSLMSISYAVFCLKKKTSKKKIHIENNKSLHQSE